MTADNKRVMLSGFALAGNVSGIALAVKRKSGFWGGVGWFLLGGMAGAAVGFLITSVIPGENKVLEDDSKQTV